MKKKLIVFLVMTLLITTALNGVATIQNNTKPNDPPPIEWSKTYGDIYQDCAFCVQQTNDGGYIFTGYTNVQSPLTPYSDVYLVKTDANGNEIWSKNMGYEDKADFGNCVQQTSDGGYVIVGSSDLGWPDYEAYWIKTDANGNIEIETRGPGQPEIEIGMCVQQTEDGGYITVGYTNSYDPNYQMWLVKKDANLVYEWDKNFGSESWGKWIECTSDGGYILTGNTRSPTHSYQMLLVKTDANGNEEWFKTFGETEYEDSGCVKQTDDGGYIIVGITDANDPTQFNVYVVKTDAYGNIDWSKEIGSPDIYESCNSVDQTYDGGYILVGAKYGDLYFIKLDSYGNIEWEGTYGGEYDDWGTTVHQTSDGGYIIAGVTYSYGTENEYSDAWLVKLETLNNRPNKPSGSYDQGNDELVVSTTDPDSDKVRYGVSWDNDGDVDQWTTFYDSGVETRINCGGRAGPLGVIAEDEFGAQSDWTSVNTRNKPFSDRTFLNFLQNIMDRFPLFARLLRL
jgi:hypothetical protein